MLSNKQLTRNLKQDQTYLFELKALTAKVQKAKRDHNSVAFFLKEAQTEHFLLRN
jgi:hypothetical protein